jgi:Patatin-like phospholipase
VEAYSPERRTALVLCGTGALGAYHAGVLRALEEAGVKIDVMAGQGVGAASAALAAIDGSSRLSEAGGVWRNPAVSRFYSWSRPLRAIVWIAAIVLVILLTPLLYLAAGLAVYAVGFVLEMVGNETGARLIAAYSEWLQRAFAGENLPTLVPRVAVLTLTALVLGLMAFVGLGHWRAPVKRRAEGSWLWRVFGAPLEADSIARVFGQAIWKVIRGAAGGKQLTDRPLGRRYAEVLAENLGQPGFRELMIVATDLDAKRDIIAALLREPYRGRFIASQQGRERAAEAVDLAGVGRDHAFEIIAAALTPPFACEPRIVTFAPDSFWRGETHRLCDRPGSLIRLLEELSAAGVLQAIIVSAVAPILRPHKLALLRLDVRSRLGELLTASESAALRDAVEVGSTRFGSVYVICPPHNPIGPFDVRGAYDEASDRRQAVAELMEHGYQDAYRQFVEPVVGASGEQLARPSAGADAPGGHQHGDRVFNSSDSPR